MKKEKIWFLVQEFVVVVLAVCLISIYGTSCEKESIVPQKKETPKPVIGSGAPSRALVN